MSFLAFSRKTNKRKENAIYPLPLVLVNYRFFQELFWSCLNAKWRCVLEFVTDKATVSIVCDWVCVILQVRELETDPLFNSGRGSALTAKGTVEMEASIMDGHGRRCGAVSGLTTVKNPVSLARLVMDKSPHSYLAFSGAEEFARQQVNLPFYPS
jgi:hypothetical protein